MSPSYTTLSPTQPSNDSSLSAILAASSHQNRNHPRGQPQRQSMDGRQEEYSQSGLSSPYTHFPDHHSESGSADPASAAQYQSNIKFDPEVSSYSTPSSHYNTPGSDFPPQQSARSSTFPDYIAQQQRSYPDSAQRYQQPAAHPGQHAAMTQASPSTPSSFMRSPNGVASHAPSNSDSRLPIDPSITASSPTYAPHQQYSPYPPQHEMQQYATQPGAPMYAPRPDWAGHYGPPMYGHVPATAGGGAPGMVAQVARPPPVYGYPGYAPMHAADPSRQGGHPLSTVYSFVPIPGAQQHKRPRRRYEEIERMYKCGWNGCEKAYGTLNHLNAHVTMQSHGSKRTPEGEHFHFLILTRVCKHLRRVFGMFWKSYDVLCHVVL